LRPGPAWFWLAGFQSGTTTESARPVCPRRRLVDNVAEPVNCARQDRMSARICCRHTRVSPAADRNRRGLELGPELARIGHEVNTSSPAPTIAWQSRHATQRANQNLTFIYYDLPRWCNAGAVSGGKSALLRLQWFAVGIFGSSSPRCHSTGAPCDLRQRALSQLSWDR